MLELLDEVEDDDEDDELELLELDEVLELLELDDDDELDDDELDDDEAVDDEVVEPQDPHMTTRYNRESEFTFYLNYSIYPGNRAESLWSNSHSHM